MEAPRDIAESILALERAALERWCKGDPDGFLEICAPDVVYFDPFIDRRIDGLDALRAYYAGIRGTIFASRFEILEPLVQLSGAIAVLTFRFVSFGGSEDEYRWNCTEVYRRGSSVWRIIQTHWSFTRGRRS
jgi:ketosteroid isomerase-like protein